jgi:hypothetical protein
LTTTLLTLIALASPALAADAQVKLLAGEGPAGQIVAVTTDRVTIRNSAGEQSIAASELMWVELNTLATEVKSSVWVELLDGSRLSAVAYTSAAGQAKVELTSGQIATVATRAIKSVRFKAQDPALGGQWREILESQATGDMVVIRKTSMRPVQEGEEAGTVTEVALDQLEGTVLDVGPESVQFEFDGEKIDVRREKLEGLVYYHPARREFSLPACKLVDIGGSTWSIKSLELVGDRLQGSTVGGVALDLPLAAIAKIDYSVGNVFFLTDLEPDTGAGDPAVSLQPAAMAFKFGRVFGVRSGPPLGAARFQIDGQTFSNGLSLHSPVNIVYRVPDGVRWLRARAGVDDSVIVPGRFDLVILADGKERFRQSFGGQQDRKPVPIDLEIAGVKRITIVLDPADGQDIGDQLDLCEARLTK